MWCRSRFGRNPTGNLQQKGNKTKLMVDQLRTHIEHAVRIWPNDAWSACWIAQLQLPGLLRSRATVWVLKDLDGSAETNKIPIGVTDLAQFPFFDLSRSRALCGSDFPGAQGRYGFSSAVANQARLRAVVSRIIWWQWCAIAKISAWMPAFRASISASLSPGESPVLCWMTSVLSWMQSKALKIVSLSQRASCVMSVGLRPSRLKKRAPVARRQPEAVWTGCSEVLELSNMWAMFLRRSAGFWAPMWANGRSVSPFESVRFSSSTMLW